MAKSSPAVIDDVPIIGDSVIFYPNGKFSHEKFSLGTVFVSMNGIMSISLRSMVSGQVIPGLRQSVHRLDSEFLMVNPQVREAGAWETCERHTELVEQWRTTLNRQQQEAAQKTQDLRMRNEQAMKDRRHKQDALAMFALGKSTEEIAAKLGRDLSWVQTAIDTTPKARVP